MTPIFYIVNRKSDKNHIFFILKFSKNHWIFLIFTSFPSHCINTLFAFTYGSFFRTNQSCKYSLLVVLLISRYVPLIINMYVLLDCKWIGVFLVLFLRFRWSVCLSESRPNLFSFAGFIPRRFTAWNKCFYCFIYRTVFSNQYFFTSFSILWRDTKSLDVSIPLRKDPSCLISTMIRF